MATTDSSVMTVVKSISRLDFGKVKSKDLGDISINMARDCPVIFPEPDGFVANITVTRDSTGTPSQARKTLEYDLKYRYLYAPVSQERPGLNIYNQMVDTFFEILAVIINNDTVTGAIDIWPISLPSFGGAVDPAGNTYEGCEFVLHIKEYWN